MYLSITIIKKTEKWRCALPIQFCVFSKCIPHDVENKALFLEEKKISFRNRKGNLRKVIGHEHIPNEIHSKAPHPPKKKKTKRKKNTGIVGQKGHKLAQCPLQPENKNCTVWNLVSILCNSNGRLKSVHREDTNSQKNILLSKALKER